MADNKKFKALPLPTALYSSGVSAASGLLGKPGTYQKSPGSWDLRYPLPKSEKSADLAHYFSGVANFFVQKNKTSNKRGSISGLNRIFTAELPQ